MLKVGSGCLTTDQERTQMALWCLLAAPLLIGSDLRNMSAQSRAILLNGDAIAVDQVGLN
jgi:alpha-galactosidase